MPKRDENIEIKRQLFGDAMEGEWKAVVKTYKKYPEVHVAKITKSGDTALHLAVSDGQDQFVKQLVDTIYEADSKAKKDERGGGGVGGGGEPAAAPEALMIKNERGNTPLHLAAASGSLAMCCWIANKHPNLIFIRNNEQMNPLFLAALNGKKDAFLRLDNLCGKKALAHCRGSNGDTFLHAALNGEYFGELSIYLSIYLQNDIVLITLL
ncbi:Serine/threonine-protein phosphatase 6 regulatory ankyrin repeat subunit A [Camellia lanceoleosa]|uniref:Serine/threonine-protein phosphatase 6 regulatory ankyrin repeat subunit A n=1 Tax=Camellia lanceoleosa TaxID=1840588 RepID=A0ACC0F6E1_9ERIC|nr:Serine/threonine-protein phosphatase 6 regulatory ankyrin repeat subunit A [Camellia lanceoleosa]